MKLGDEYEEEEFALLLRKYSESDPLFIVLYSDEYHFAQVDMQLSY